MNEQGTPQNPPKKSGRGCLIVIGVLGGLFFLGAVGIGIATYLAASSPKGQTALRVFQEIKTAQNAPGTPELKKLGCHDATVMDLATVGKEMAVFFDAGVATNGKGPSTLFVFCQPGPFDTPPTCADVAHTFVTAAPPSKAFVVTVRPQGDSKDVCSSLYSKAGEFESDLTKTAASAHPPHAR